MNLAFNYWRYGTVSARTVEWISEAFTTMAYYRMDPSVGRVIKRLNHTVSRLESGEIFSMEGSAPFHQVYMVLLAAGYVNKEVVRAQ